MQIFDDRSDGLFVFSDTIILIRIDDVEHVVSDSLLFFCGDFPSPDIEVSVDLSGIR